MTVCWSPSPEVVHMVTKNQQTIDHSRRNHAQARSALNVSKSSTFFLLSLQILNNKKTFGNFCKNEFLI